MNRKIINSADGTPTLYVELLNQHYHSVFGARTESEHIYIHAGLDTAQKSDIHLLEVGFGTGLNAYLSLNFKRSDASIQYLGIEKYPLDRPEWEALDYHLAGDPFPETWNDIYLCDWETWHEIIPGFKLYKKQCDFNYFSPPDGQDLIYFDAFSPDAQPDLWSLKNFHKLYSCLNPNGILVTYSVKGFVKQRLTEVGFSIEKLQGPPGKRHILRAFK